MKKLLLFLLPAIILFSCDKPGTDDGPLVKGRLVRNTCVDPIVQVIDSSYFHLGESWAASGLEGALQNVFTVNNICDFQKCGGLEEGDEFYFSVITDPRSRACAVCDMITEAPAKRLNISVRK